MSTQENLSQLLRRGSRAVVAAQVASQLVSLGVLAALYRLLGLEPFGLVGMVLPLLLLGRILIASGLDVATIQQDKLTDEQVSALFWLNQGLGVVMAGATAAMAPVLVWFYGLQELGPLTVALAGTSVALALGTQHQALFRRKLRLATLAAVRLTALVLGGVSAVVAAVGGWGVWALVLQQYIELLVLAGLLWSFEPWRPKFRFFGTQARSLVRFGGYCTLSSLMAYLAANVDKILVGYALGPAALALYGQAFNLMMKPVNLMLTPLTGVMLAFLSRAHANPRHYRELLLGFFRFIGLAMLPSAVGLAIVAPEAIRVLGGPQWADAGPILAVLAVAVLAQGFLNALGSVFASAGRADRLAIASTVAAGVLSFAFFVGLFVGQSVGEPLLGIAASYTLTTLVVVFPAYLGFALRTVGVRWVDWLAQLRTAALGTMVMGLVVAACHLLLPRVPGMSDLPLLLAEIILGVATYALCARHEIRWFLREALSSSSSR